MRTLDLEVAGERISCCREPYQSPHRPAASEGAGWDGSGQLCSLRKLHSVMLRAGRCAAKRAPRSRSLSPSRTCDAPWCSDDALQGGPFCAYQNLCTLHTPDSPTYADWPQAHDAYARIFEQAKRSCAPITVPLSSDLDSSNSDSITESPPHSMRSI